MPRTARLAPGGMIYHVFNRGVGKTTLFRSRKDFQEFQRCLAVTQASTSMRILAYCVMGNHWHLVLWPRADGDLAHFMLRLTTTHVRRRHVQRRQAGGGHVYQGRYKSFAVAKDDHLSTVCRYVERNPVRNKTAAASADWPWSSAGHHALARDQQVELTDLPGGRRDRLASWVDRPQTAAEEAAMSQCLKQNRPFGSDQWVSRMREKLGWREPMKIGRPRKPQ